MVEDDDTPQGAAADGARDRRDDQWQDRAESAMEAGRSEREARREDKRFGRLLRDNAILKAELAASHARLAAAEATTAKTRLTGITSDLEQAEKDVERAQGDGDAAAIARAQRRLAELAANKTAATLQQQQAEQQAQRQHEEAEAEKRRASSTPALSATTQRWVEANAWYGSDERMTRHAQLAHQDAVDDGIKPDTPAYWRYIEEQMETRFPGKVSALHSPRREAEPAGERAEATERVADPAAAARVPATSGAAPVSRNAGNGAAAASKSLTLSAEAMDICRAMGMKPQEYAAHAMRLAKAGAVNLSTIQGTR